MEIFVKRYAQKVDKGVIYVFVEFFGRSAGMSLKWSRILRRMNVDIGNEAVGDDGFLR